MNNATALLLICLSSTFNISCNDAVIIETQSADSVVVELTADVQNLPKTSASTKSTITDIALPDLDSGGVPEAEFPKSFVPLNKPLDASFDRVIFN
ncbi:hypothetical protein [Sphingobacterium hungaricum]|uniref:Uncharacterized protein n=1 Tax=Sphingobacterium hungaricum TaxID=2082723 RepID=A0A928UW65_9SPHI|nr:hypothetical protein [Sphingobacterium hungaricum]MBE8714355.1 hypothetical protein [Sphingobacterium hungaricum]